jgi:hypothetical protein
MESVNAAGRMPGRACAMELGTPALGRDLEREDDLSARVPL